MTSPLRIVLWSLVAGASSLAQAPNLRPERTLPNVPVLGPAPETQSKPALARGATSSLLVFEDRRAGDFDVYGLRLDAAGVPLESVPFPITKAPGDQTAPKVEWNGTAWLVTYKNQVDPGSGYFAYEVAAQRVSAQGVVLDAAPLALFRDDTGFEYGVASDGVNWLVAGAGFSAGNSDLVGRRIAGNGALLDPTPVVIVPGTFSIFFSVRVSSAGGNYLVTWSDSGLRGRRVTGALQPIDTSNVLVSPHYGVVGSNGAQYFLAWSFQNPSFQVEVRGSRLSTALALLDPNGLPLSGATTGDAFVDPSVTWDGTQWIASWLHFGTQQQRAARVRADGVVLDPSGVAVPDAAPSVLYTPALGALAGGGALLLWSDYRFDTDDVFGTRFGANGVPGTERCYSVGADALLVPRVCAGAEQYVVTFRTVAAASSRIVVQRVDGFGNPLDATPIVVASAAHTGLHSGAVAWNGTHYLVTWSDSKTGAVSARRLRSDGTFVDAAPIQVLLGSGADVSALGGDFLVTALRAPSYPEFVYSYGARVRGSDGVVLDAPPLALGTSFATRARSAALGGRWLVATEAHFSHNSNQAGVQLTFVDPQGAVTQGSNISVLNIQDWGSIDVASSGTSALVVAQSGSNWTNCEVFAQRVLPNGTLSGALLRLTGNDAGGQSRASVVWTGEEYVVSYQSYQNNVWSYDFEPDVYAVRVSEAGTLRDANGFALWNGEDYERAVDAAGLGGGRALFVVSKYVDAPYSAFQIATRELRTTGIASYGDGTAGCAGAQRMFANGVPRLGAVNFALQSDRAPANAVGALLLAGQQDLAGTFVPALGIRLHVGLGGPLVDLATNADASGIGSRVVPVPQDAALLGATLHAQSVWPWGSTCTLPPLGLSASDGLAVTIQG